MRNLLLFPHKYRRIGLILLPIAIAILIAAYMYEFSIPFLKYHADKNGHIQYLFSGQTEYIFSRDFAADYTGTVGMVMTFAALFLIAFSKEKHEDEYISLIRLRALQISVYVNYLILGLAALMLFGLSFILIMEVNLFTILVLFIIIYQYLLRANRAASTRSA